jgi:hypothetical protein
VTPSTNEAKKNPRKRAAAATSKAAPTAERRTRRAALPPALWLVAPAAGSSIEGSVYELWRAARARGWDVAVALPWRTRGGPFGAPGEVLERLPVELELGPGEFRGEARRTAGPGAADRLYWLVPQSADLAPASTSAFLCAGALDLARRDDRRLVHLVGLRSALAPVLLSTRLGADPRFEALRTVLMLDEAGDLGLIDATTLHDLGLPSGLLADPMGGIEDGFSALKGGVVFADRVVVQGLRERRALERTAVGRALRERAREAVSISWTGRRSFEAALDRLVALDRGLLRRPPRRIEVAVPPRAAAEAPDAAPPAPPAEPFIDWGPALPERYGEDACELLVQGPRALYGYWELSPETGRAAAGGELRLRLRSRGGERDLGRVPAAVGEWWIEGEPGEAYVLDILAADGRVLLRSAPARTPPEGPSPRGDVRMVPTARAGAGGAGPGLVPRVAGLGRPAVETPAGRSPGRLMPLPAPARAGQEEELAAAWLEVAAQAADAEEASARGSSGAPSREPSARSPAPSSQFGGSSEQRPRRAP